jgi:hypothetical protein
MSFFLKNSTLCSQINFQYFLYQVVFHFYSIELNFNPIVELNLLKLNQSKFHSIYLNSIQFNLNN